MQWNVCCTDRRRSHTQCAFIQERLHGAGRQPARWQQVAGFSAAIEAAEASDSNVRAERGKRDMQRMTGSKMSRRIVGALAAGSLLLGACAPAAPAPTAPPAAATAVAKTGATAAAIAPTAAAAAAPAATALAQAAPTVAAAVATAAPSVVAAVASAAPSAVAAASGAATAAAKPAGVVGVSPKPATPPSPAIPIKMVWTAVTGANSGLWTAYEAGYFAEEGIDAELLNIPSSSRAIAAMLSGEVQYGNTDPANLVQASVAGGAMKAFVAITNRLVFSVMGVQSIQDPKRDLKGKKLGITRTGSSTHTAALQALKLWGLQPNTDVSFIQLTEVPNIFAALSQNQIDAGIMSPPTNTRAKAAGFKELMNLATEGPEYPSVAVASTKKFLDENPEAARRFTRAYIRGIQRFKSDKAFGTQAINKYLKVDDQAVLDDTWQQFSMYLPDVPYVSEKGMQQVIDDVSVDEPKAKGTSPSDYVETKFIKELEDSGFFKRP